MENKPPETLGAIERIIWYVNHDEEEKAAVLSALCDHLEANFSKSLYFLTEGTHSE